ncbi:MAG: folate family ECF transporter S component [Gudongella sp.]|nr:folate family ECF transporter S component [Gudongella sp.]
MRRKTAKINVRTMVKAGFLVAISIVMTRFAYVMVPLAGVSALRISFGDLPLMLSGMMFGPLVGGLTGFSADIIGFLINPQGPYHPGFTLSSILWGVIPGLVFYRFRGERDYEKVYSYKNIVLAVLLVTVVVSLGLNTYWLSTLYGRGFIVLLPTRVLAALISIPLHTVIIKYLMKYLRRFI